MTGVWLRQDGHRVLKSPSGYLLSAQCKDRVWIGWCRDPEQTTAQIRMWCPFPIRDVEFRAMPREKVGELLVAIEPWRVRRGGGWHRTPPEMLEAMERLSGQSAVKTVVAS